MARRSALKSSVKTISGTGVRPAPSLDSRPKVNTFDVFDTLIARRCIEPFRIFEMIAAHAKIETFVSARRLAEANVAHAPYDLDIIYANLMTILGIRADEAAELKALEIRFELENVIPIAANMTRVTDGDILISDMYLGAGLIRSLLAKAGFQKNVALVVTPDGKHSGQIWPRVIEKFEIQEHLGDNAYSDNLMPSRFGIANRHTDISAPNFVEKTLLDIGLRDLALICREARLAASATGHAHSLQVLQASLNFPILTLASIALARLAKREGLESLLFCSRDCNLWLPLFRSMAQSLGFEGQANYFYTSRLTRTKPSADYLAYARENVKPGVAVVDICGTGWSLAHLFQNLGLDGQHLVFLHKLPPVDLYEKAAPTPPTSISHALLGSTDERCDHVVLEMSNYAEHGMTLDVRRIGESFVPVFAQDQRPAAIFDMIEAQQRCFRHAVAIMEKHSLKETLSIDDASLNVLCTALYQSLSNQEILKIAYAAAHHAEDITTLTQLGCL